MAEGGRPPSPETTEAAAHKISTYQLDWLLKLEELSYQQQLRRAVRFSTHLLTSLPFSLLDQSFAE